MSSSTWPDHRKSTGSSRTCESPLSRDSGHKCSRRRCWCVRGLLLESYCPPQVVRLFLTGCLRSSFTCVDVSHFIHFVLVLILARCIRFSGPLFLLHSPCLGDPIFVCIHPCSNIKVRFFPSTFVQQMFWFFPGIHHCGVWSLFHWMQTQHNQPSFWPWDSMSADITSNLFDSVSRILSTTTLDKEIPFLFYLLWLSSSYTPQALSFDMEYHTNRSNSLHPTHHPMFVSSNSRLTSLPCWWYKKTAPVKSWWPRKIPWVTRLANVMIPYSPTFRIQTLAPNCVIGFLHLRPVRIISLVFPSLPMYFWPLLNDQWQTDLPPMVSAKSLQLCIRLNCCILKWFRARFLVSPQDDSKKTKILDETDKKWNTAP